MLHLLSSILHQSCVRRCGEYLTLVEKGDFKQAQSATLPGYDDWDVAQICTNDVQKYKKKQ